jgi:hypothetical protein
MHRPNIHNKSQRSRHLDLTDLKDGFIITDELAKPLTNKQFNYLLQMEKNEISLNDIATYLGISEHEKLNKNKLLAELLEYIANDLKNN